MALPVPNLDDRSFQSLVDQAKQRISERCPEWTEHNVSDPGVTLIELFAQMTEVILYRLNQVPEKNYLKFLEMIGIDLMPGDAARAGITFPLAAGWPGVRVPIPRDTEIATEPVGEEEPIVFYTERDLLLANPEILYVVADCRSETRTWNHTSPFRIWSDPGPDNHGERPQVNDALYLGFYPDITGYLLEVEFDVTRSAAGAFRPNERNGEWEYYNTMHGAWERLPTEGEDSTYGLDRSGTIRFRIPWEHFDSVERSLHGYPAWWIRYRFTREYELLHSPELLGLTCRVLAGTVPAINSARIEEEGLGVSDGSPGQAFRVRNPPVLKLLEGETVEVEGDDGGWDRWELVEDFASSWPNHRHYVLDTTTGEVRFGPVVMQPDGVQRQAGAIPAKNRRIRFSSYRHGGGSRANLPPNTLRVLRQSIPYIDPNGVTNLDRASGGSDREELAHAKLRGQERLRSLTRAVTKEDFEYHARQAVQNAIERAYCITPAYPGDEPEPATPAETEGVPGPRRPPPGEVRVLIVPRVSGDATRLNFAEHLHVESSLRTRVWQHLEQRKLLTTRVVVEEPQYLWVSTDVRVRLDPRHARGQVRADVERALHRFVNPLVGGLDGKGWPFGYPLRQVDLRAVIQGVPGVRYIEELQVFVRHGEQPQWIELKGEQFPSQGALDSWREWLVFSDDHRVQFSE